MKNQSLLYLTISFVFLFSFTPAISQSWQDLMNQASVYQQQHDTLNTNLYAEKAFQKAKTEFSLTDARYLKILDLYVESTIHVLQKLGDKGKPHYTAALRELSILYAISGIQSKADSLIYLSRESEIEYIQKADLSWEELSNKSDEYYQRGDFELSLGYAENALKKAVIF